MAKTVFLAPGAWTSTELSELTPFGFAVPIDLSELVVEVRVDSSVPDWFATVITDVTKKMGFNFKVIQSVLGEDPIF